jgi:hypothetical protein
MHARNLGFPPPLMSMVKVLGCVSRGLRYKSMVYFYSLGCRVSKGGDTSNYVLVLGFRSRVYVHELGFMDYCSVNQETPLVF